jgi:hypothetical protein
MDLARLAFIDYRDGRYHACVPVVLSLMDGLVNDLNKKQNRSFFSKDSDLRAWDCITAHEKGLNALKEVMHVGRYGTTTDEISIPFRNGILHGMDLGYANKTVAVKTWAALFAVKDWASKVERNELIEPAAKPKASWGDLAEKILENKKVGEKLEQWNARTLTIGKDVPKTGSAEDYEVGTPERRLIEFLLFWKKRNYGDMAKCIWSELQAGNKKMAGRVRETYQSYSMQSFEILEVLDEAPVITEIKVSVKYVVDDTTINNIVKFRLVINSSTDGKIKLRGMPDSSWGITNWEYGTFNIPD